MKYSVYIRPLRLEDALISYQWRNNPRIWRHTGSRPDRYITPEIETEWIKGILAKDTEKRFAICRSSDDKYIGNIFLSNVSNGTGELHIFIGSIEYWGKGHAYEAALQLIKEGFDSLNLTRIIAEIRKENRASLTLSKITEFRIVGETEEFFQLEFTREMYDNELHLRYLRSKS